MQKIIKTWKAYEEKYILVNHKKLSDEQMAVSLGRTTKSIQMKRIRMRLTLTKRRDISWWKANEEQKELNLAVRRGREVARICQRMNELISLCENEESLYIKDKYKSELKTLSGL